jgi:hypothetical protein
MAATCFSPLDRAAEKPALWSSFVGDLKKLESLDVHDIRQASCCCFKAFGAVTLAVIGGQVGILKWLLVQRIPYKPNVNRVGLLFPKMEAPTQVFTLLQLARSAQDGRAHMLARLSRRNDFAFVSPPDYEGVIALLEGGFYTSVPWDLQRLLWLGQRDRQSVFYGCPKDVLSLIVKRCRTCLLQPSSS